MVKIVAKPDPELQDLAKMKIEDAEDMKLAFSCIAMIERMSAVELKHSGHKTKEEGIVYHVRSTLKKIDERTKAFLKKYPD